LELASISMVGDELKKGHDKLAEWAKEYPALLHDASDDATQEAFGQVVAALAEQAPLMKTGALEDFLEGADPWLIAKAMTTGATVVTHEVYNPDIKRKFSIPNVCKLFDVPYM